MKKYIGTRIILAVAMTRLAYNELRGWTLPSDENGEDKGFKVEDAETKHVSWLPEEEFNNLYSETKGMTFGDAIEAIKKGYKVARAGWNGKGMFLFLVPGSNFKVNRPPLLGIYPEGAEINYQPHIDMKTAQDTVVPWLASQSDILADDWQIVED